ncbi:hypothetical protein ABT340_15540 [Streptosporangium sp. NPDC000239]|uniref:hypothetical protein n=1 Tax=Streptosporangium sp. NPDC000239 TaxID=3154248 RepID=UPI0033329DEF
MKISGEWELTLEELATLFEAKGWCYHTDQGLIIPNARLIERVLTELISDVLKHPRDEAQGGRFMVWKDPELANAYDLWLNVGFMWDDDALSEEERAILAEEDE